jgi:uncharacterized protein (TIGR03118 family)
MKNPFESRFSPGAGLRAVLSSFTPRQPKISLSPFQLIPIPADHGERGRSGLRWGQVKNFSWGQAGILAALLLGTSSQLAADDVLRHYQQTNLVSDITGFATTPDSRLQNPWGLAHSATSAWWISDNGTGLSTLYNGAGAIQTLFVNIPNVPGATGPSAPTGIVANNSTTDFLVAPGAPAHFLFATEDGIIAGWNKGNQAVSVGPPSNFGPASYKGLTIAQNNGANLLYAANFLAGHVDVFNGKFTPVDLGASAFQDPDLPTDYAPFNVQSIGNVIYVTFAERMPNSINEIDGQGIGAVDVFSPAGVLQMHLKRGHWFNAPWGVALAPANFGVASGRILIGQFGSGRIATFDSDGEFRGFLRGPEHDPLTIDKLWALGFGNGANAGPTTTLFFTSGFAEEMHGIFGSIAPIPDGDSDQDDGD